MSAPVIEYSRHETDKILVHEKDFFDNVAWLNELGKEGWVVIEPPAYTKVPTGMTYASGEPMQKIMAQGIFRRQEGLTWEYAIKRAEQPILSANVLDHLGWFQELGKAGWIVVDHGVTQENLGMTTADGHEMKKFVVMGLFRRPVVEEVS